MDSSRKVSGMGLLEKEIPGGWANELRAVGIDSTPGRALWEYAPGLHLQTGLGGKTGSGSL